MTYLLNFIQKHDSVKHLQDLQFICDQRWTGELRSLVEELSSKIDLKPVITTDRDNLSHSPSHKFPRRHLLDEPRDLEPNLVRGSYKSDEEYLRIQRNLLEEDFVRPLRGDLLKFRDGRTSDLDNVYDYGAGEIIEKRLTRVAIQLHFLLRKMAPISARKLAQDDI